MCCGFVVQHAVQYNQLHNPAAVNRKLIQQIHILAVVEIGLYTTDDLGSGLHVDLISGCQLHTTYKNVVAYMYVEKCDIAYTARHIAPKFVAAK